MRFQLPEHGTIRVKLRFAFLPIIVDGEKVWLEFYDVVEQYTRFFSDHDGHWRSVRRRRPA